MKSRRLMLILAVLFILPALAHAVPRTVIVEMGSSTW